ncbi:PREDICTED: bark storage protein B-like [Populus euphratica]|uniref:Bark storage protein B-like n=1 Tax=Populus euphratica TaxID=75702 RepID=A0AAJ6TTC4_POPEU|nr:PREDICTED: bark storage protein B-like [Populus euphratica]
MSSINLAVLLVLGLLLVTAQQSMQMSLRNPTAEIETSNCKIAFLRLGLVFTSDNNEKALLDSGLYEADSENPSVDIAGRRFHIGTLNNSLIIYVKTGSHSVNVATAVQILLLRFRTSGIIFFGSSGSLDEKILVPGDVAVPKAVAFTGVWDWKKFRSEEGKLVFGDFNYPENGENLLGTVEYQKINMFSPHEAAKEVFWLPITTSWYNAATEALKVCQSQKCYSGKCLPGKPKVVFGSKGSTSDFYVRNKAYGDFLNDNFGATTADTASASVALTSLSNEKLFVVFQGVSNVAGETNSESGISYLASYNAFLAATKFINSIPTPRLACE